MSNTPLIDQLASVMSNLFGEVVIDRNYGTDAAHVTKPEFILAVNRKYLAPLNLKQGFNAIPYEKLLYAIQGGLILGQRQHLDLEPHYDDEGRLVYVGDRSAPQLLPYRLIGRVGENGPEFLVYLRGAGVGEQALANRASCGLGGHVDAPDVVWVPNPLKPHDGLSVIDPHATLLVSSAREMEEELEIRKVGPCTDPSWDHVTEHNLPADRVHYLGLIQDHGDAVGHLHLGIASVLDVTGADGLHFDMKEEELTSYGFHTPKDILANFPNLEGWTRILMEQFVKGVVA